MPVSLAAGHVFIKFKEIIANNSPVDAFTACTLLLFTAVQQSINSRVQANSNGTVNLQGLPVLLLLLLGML